ncbi:hypothetical protein M885DRAFT_621067 [Pelagophyceae sp. CCMP2097]|nr:hypothetical protein M885DRAFT_621067 [Pelagophyceae sp. CCMP2097]
MPRSVLALVQMGCVLDCGRAFVPPSGRRAEAPSPWRLRVFSGDDEVSALRREVDRLRREIQADEVTAAEAAAALAPSPPAEPEAEARPTRRILEPSTGRVDAAALLSMLDTSLVPAGCDAAAELEAFGAFAGFDDMAGSTDVLEPAFDAGLADQPDHLAQLRLSLLLKVDVDPDYSRLFDSLREAMDDADFAEAKMDDSKMSDEFAAAIGMRMGPDGGLEWAEDAQRRAARASVRLWRDWCAMLEVRAAKVAASEFDGEVAQLRAAVDGMGDIERAFADKYKVSSASLRQLAFDQSTEAAAAGVLGGIVYNVDAVAPSLAEWRFKEALRAATRPAAPSDADGAARLWAAWTLAGAVEARSTSVPAQLAGVVYDAAVASKFRDQFRETLREAFGEEVDVADPATRVRFVTEAGETLDAALSGGVVVFTVASLLFLWATFQFVFAPLFGAAGLALDRIAGAATENLGSLDLLFGPLLNRLQGGPPL